MVTNAKLDRRSFIATATGLCAATVFSSCAKTTAQPAKAPIETSNYFFDTMAARSNAISTVNFDKEIADWLPNHLFEIDGEAARPLGAGLATGTITGVVGGKGYVAGSDDSSKIVPFDSPDALWRTVDVTMSVTQAWGEVAKKEAVQFGVAFGGNKDSDRILASLSSLGTVVAAFLRQGFYQYDAGLYGIGRNGLLLGTVNSLGTLQFPSLAALDDDVNVEKVFLSETLTAMDLESQAAKEQEVIRIKGGERL